MSIVPKNLSGVPPIAIATASTALDRFQHAGQTTPGPNAGVPGRAAVAVELKALATAQHGDMLAALTALAQAPGQATLSHLLKAVLNVELPRSPAVVDMLIAIMADPANGLSTHHASRACLAFLQQAKDEGHVFTDLQRDRLILVAGWVEASSPGRRGRTVERRDRRRGHEFYDLIDALPADEDLPEGRLDARPSPNRFRPLPDGIDFWCAFLDRVADKAETLARDFAGGGLPGWTASQAAFDARFPSAAGMPTEFGFWRRAELRRGAAWDWRDFWAMRAAPPAYRGKLDLPRLSGPALRVLRERTGPLAALEWGQAWLPAAETLLGHGTDDDRALLTSLLSAPMGVQPPAQWRRDVLRLANAIGKDEVRRRALAWLALFHTPGASRETLAELTLCHWRALTAASFARVFPHWTRLAEADVDRLADWVAVVTMGYNAGFNGTVRNFFAWHRHHGGWPDDTPQLRYPDSAADEAMLDERLSHVLPTSENERVLRAVVWLLGMVPAPACIDALKRTAVAASALGESGPCRSRNVAHAAIATLGAIGGEAALDALGQVA